MARRRTAMESSLILQRRRARSALPTLAGRIYVAVLCVTIVAMLAIWIGVNKSVGDYAAQSGDAQLRDARIALDAALAQRLEQQLRGASAAARTPALAEALRLPPSVRSEDFTKRALRDASAALDDVELVLRDSEERFVASSSGRAPREVELARAARLTELDANAQQGVARVGGVLSLVTRVGLFDDEARVGTLLATEALTPRVAEELSRACGADVTIVVDDRAQALAGSLRERELTPDQARALARVRDEAAAERVPLADVALYATARGLGEGERIVLSQPSEARAGLHDSLRRWLLPTAIALLLATLVLARFVARRLTRPIAELSKIAHVIAGGALDTQVPHNARTAEIARLQDAFHEMTARLRDVLEDVQNKNEVLATQRDELARANRAKSNFLATASHELRTPISSIRSFSEILLAGDADDEPEETREEFLDIIRSESVRLARLVEQLLDLATIESGVASWQNEELDLGAVAQRTLRALEGFAKAREVKLELRNASRSYPYLGDADRLQQTILNLVGNAVKFSPKGATVTVTIQRDSFGYQIFVDDEGPGVPEAERGRIFEKFVQSEDILTDKPQGSGLGLAIVREIVRVHGGRVRCDAAPSGGARFVVRLPEAHPMRPLERFIAEAEAAKS